MATVTPLRRTTPPRYAVACSGSSTAFTKTRRTSAAASTCLLTSRGAAATTHHAPSRSASSNARRTTVTPVCTISGRTSGATTVTSAPAASSASSLLAATGPPPTTTTRRERRCRNAGNIAIKNKKARFYRRKQKSPGFYRCKQKKPGGSSRAFRSLACSGSRLFATHAADRKRRDPTGPHTTTRARPAARQEHDVRDLNARPRERQFWPVLHAGCCRLADPRPDRPIEVGQAAADLRRPRHPVEHDLRRLEAVARNADDDRLP